MTSPTFSHVATSRRRFEWPEIAAPATSCGCTCRPKRATSRRYRLRGPKRTARRARQLPISPSPPVDSFLIISLFRAYGLWHVAQPSLGASRAATRVESAAEALSLLRACGLWHVAQPPFGASRAATRVESAAEALSLFRAHGLWLVAQPSLGASRAATRVESEAEALTLFRACGLWHVAQPPFGASRAATRVESTAEALSLSCRPGASCSCTAGT